MPSKTYSHCKRSAEADQGPDTDTRATLVLIAGVDSPASTRRQPEFDYDYEHRCAEHEHEHEHEADLCFLVLVSESLEIDYAAAGKSLAPEKVSTRTRTPRLS